MLFDLLVALLCCPAESTYCILIAVFILAGMIGSIQESSKWWIPTKFVWMHMWMLRSKERFYGWERGANSPHIPDMTRNSVQHSRVSRWSSMWTKEPCISRRCQPQTVLQTGRKYSVTRFRTLITYDKSVSCKTIWLWWPAAHQAILTPTMTMQSWMMTSWTTVW